MNKETEELGLKDTHFITPHGLDEEGHYTTAYELAIISDYALNIKEFSKIVNTKTYTVHINGYSKNITNTNELLGYLDGVDGVKTGFTNGAGRCLVTSVNRNGFNIITIVLGEDTKKNRTKDSINLIEYIYSNYELIDLKKLIYEEYDKWTKINKDRIYINKAKENNINLKLKDFQYNIYPIKKEQIKDIIVEIENEKMNFEAPIVSKEKIADVFLKICTNEIINTSIVIDNNVERKGIKEYLVECVSYLY